MSGVNAKANLCKAAGYEAYVLRRKLSRKLQCFWPLLSSNAHFESCHRAAARQKALLHSHATCGEVSKKTKHTPQYLGANYTANPLLQ